MAVAKEPFPAAPSSSAPGWLARLISPSTHQLTVVGHLALGGTLLLASLTVNLWMFSFATGQERAWMNFATVAKTAEDSAALASNVNATAAERARMVDQFMLVQARAETHAQVMGLFYKLNFIALGTVGLSAGVASIALFFISKAGWERVNNALINLFIVTTGLIIFHSNLVIIFKFQDNIRLNGQLYGEYTQLYNAILTYWAIQPSAADSLAAADFIVAVDQRLGELGKISLDFDNSHLAQLSQPLEALGQPPMETAP